MTNKQLKKLARQIYQQELIHQDSSSSKEDKSQAEAEIMRLTNMIMSFPDGMDCIVQIDDMVQKLLITNNKEK